jgi:ribosomal protein S1
MQLQVRKTYRVKAADTLKIRKLTAHRDWSDVPAYLKPGDLVHIESIRHTKGGYSYMVTAGNESGVLHYDCGINLSEFVELVD